MNILPSIVFAFFCIALSLFVILLIGSVIIVQRNRRKIQNLIKPIATDRDKIENAQEKHRS